MEGRFKSIMKALIVEEGIDYNDIIKAIELVTTKTTQEKILKELCSYVDLGLTPDDIVECYEMT